MLFMGYLFHCTRLISVKPLACKALALESDQSCRSLLLKTCLEPGDQGVWFCFNSWDCNIFIYEWLYTAHKWSSKSHTSKSYWREMLSRRWQTCCSGTKQIFFKLKGHCNFRCSIWQENADKGKTVLSVEWKIMLFSCMLSIAQSRESFSLRFSRLFWYMCIVLFVCLKPQQLLTWDTKSSDFLQWSTSPKVSSTALHSCPWSWQHSWTQTPACACTQQGCSLDNPALHSWETFPVCTSILLPSGTSPAQPSTCVPPCLCWNSTSSLKHFRLKVCIGNIPWYENWAHDSTGKEVQWHFRQDPQPGAGLLF